MALTHQQKLYILFEKTYDQVAYGKKFPKQWLLLRCVILTLILGLIYFSLQ